MSINERIKMIIESQRLTAGVFADQIGVQRSNVSHVLSGRNKPSFEFLEKVLVAFPRVSAQWLMTGKQVPNGVELLAPKESEKNSDAPERKNETKNESFSDKKIVKTIVFYDDFTFDTYLLNAK